jgi:hypothetical protein
MMNCLTNFQTQSGGNVFISSGNTAWWYITYSSGNTLMNKGANYYANDFIGGSFKANIFHPARYDHYPTDLGFGGLTVSTVGETSWVFAGTGLKAGDKFGTQSLLVGYEADGLSFTRTGNSFTPTESAPAGTKLLAANTYSGGKKPGCQDASFNVSSTFCIFTRGAGVCVNEGNIDWAYGLVSDSGGTDPDRACDTMWRCAADGAVKQITRNILVKLGNAPLKTESPELLRKESLCLAISPNPFTQGVRLDFDAGVKANQALIAVYDLHGRLLRSLTANSGAGSIMWDGRDQAGHPMASACYLVRLEQGKSGLSRVVILKR